MRRAVNIIPLILGALGLFFLLPQAQPAHGGEAWNVVEPGLELGFFTAPEKSEVGDSTIRILRIDPSRFQLRLLNASTQNDKQRQSAKNWALSNGLIATINASMYQKDLLTSVSYMKTGNHINNKWVSKDKTLLAFDPKDKTLPRVRIIDRECDDLDQLRQQYETLIQSIRMVSCQGENVWSPQARKWSTAALGMDSTGHVLFIHVRSPYSTHNLINHLLALPIGIDRLMYVEGGSEAQMYINSGKTEHEFVGGYTSDGQGSFAWPIPNVIGIVRAQAPENEHTGGRIDQTKEKTN